jgi:hypothetical protein
MSTRVQEQNSHACTLTTGTSSTTGSSTRTHILRVHLDCQSLPVPVQVLPGTE